MLRYLSAFGPATPGDAQTWSGLAALAPVFDELRPQLRTFADERGRELFDLPDAPRPAADTRAPARLVPAFDNLVLGHADRSRIITDEHRAKVCTPNLRVLPTFLVDGFVAGLWRIERARKTATLSLTPFGKLRKKARLELTEEAQGLLRFAEPDAESFDVTFAKGR